MSEWHPAETAPKDGRPINVVYQGWTDGLDTYEHEIAAIRWNQEDEYWQIIVTGRYATSDAADRDFVLWADIPPLPDLPIKDITPRWVPDPSKPEQHGKFAQMTREQYVEEFGEEVASVDLTPATAQPRQS